MSIYVHNIIVLQRALFVREYPEIAAATFLGQQVERDQLVIYIGSCSRAQDRVQDSAQAEILDLDDRCELYQKQHGQVSEMPSNLLVIAGRDISIRYSLSPQKVSFWALEGAVVRVVYKLQNSDVSMHCYGAAHSSIQIDMLVNNQAPTSHARIALALHPQGRDAQMRVRGAYRLKSEQSVRVSVLQNHTAPNTRTDVIIKGIVQDKGQAYYEGLIFIDKPAVNTCAVQENKNIILGAHAVVDSRPTLEALNHEVSCAHGSAVGQLDSEQLFYLTSRGLDVQQAQTMLLDGFIGDLFDPAAQALFGEIKAGEIKI